jgi:hypothetical protein
LEDVLTRSVPQIDLVPTLSLLLGLPIPATSIGKMIPALLHTIPVSQQLYALHYNCKQVATQFRNNVANSATQGNWKVYFFTGTIIFTSCELTFKLLFDLLFYMRINFVSHPEEFAGFLAYFIMLSQLRM